MKSGGDDAGPGRPESARGTAALYLVGTPIGNLEDITLRALRILKEAEIVACEDTRHTQKLLNHFGISARVTSYHEHNEFTRAAELVQRLEQGSKIALVTDAGMPGISDPGFSVISLAVARGIPVIPIPGPSAFLTALSASGLPMESFRFHGFLPSKRGQRRERLQGIRSSQEIEAFYEAPHRIKESLQDIVEIMGENRRVVLARELTKIHEEFLRGTAAGVLHELAQRDTVKGEITLLIAPVEGDSLPATTSLSIRQRLNQIIADENVDRKTALKKIAKERGISKSEAYRELQLSRE